MTEGRRQLPPQIKRVELASRAGVRPVVRYQLTVDVGVVDGKRKQLRKRFATEKAARDELDDFAATSPAGPTCTRRKPLWRKPVRTGSPRSTALRHRRSMVTDRNSPRPPR